MNQQAVARQHFEPRDLDLIRRTVARDCNQTEFDLFAHICRHRGLDPLRRHIYAWVFNKNDPEKRNMVPVISQEGQLLIADRLGNYRPDERTPEYEYDEAAKNPLTNPLGLVKAVVTLWKHSHGAWHPVAGEAYWDEFAPIVEGADEYEWVETGEFWEDSGKPKRRKMPKGEVSARLDPNKTGWLKSPRLMLAKCARMQAARLGWPDDFGGLYVEEEMDRRQSLDMTASEQAEMAATERRLDAIRARDTVMIDWLGEAKAIEPTPLGKVADRCMELISRADLETLELFMERNRHALREFWAKAPGDALEVKKSMEQAIDKAKKSKARADALIADLRNDNVVYSLTTLEAWMEAMPSRTGEDMSEADQARIGEAFEQRSQEIADRENADTETLESEAADDEG